MGTNAPGRLVFPLIFVIGFMLLSLSGFIGSVYRPARNTPGNDSPVVLEPGLSDKYPPSIQQWEALIEAASQDYQVDASLIAAVMLQESGGNAQVVSSSGAVGLMQVMPRDGAAAAFLCGSQPCFTNRPSMDQLFDPEFNIRYGTRMLANLIKKEGSILEALYHYGPMDVGYAYAEIVLTIYDRYQ